MQFRHGARGRRAVPAAHRGHRRGALPAGIRAGDLRRPGVARHRLGGTGAAPERAFRRLPRGAGAARCAGPGLSELRKPRRDRAPGRRARDARALAARSRRCAALSRRCALALAGRTPAADGGRRALCAAPRHGGGDRAHRRADLDARPARVRRRDRARSRRRRRPGATWCWRARRRRPAITSRSWSTTRVQGVTHVVRGQDLFWSTSVHRAAAGAARPAGTDLPPPPPDP